MPLLPPRHLDTVALFEKYRKSRHRYAATGFFCRHRFGGDEAREELFLVTSARAVSGNLDDTIVVCRLRGTQQVMVNRATGHGGLARGGWFSDPELDLAVLPLNPEHLSKNRLRFRALGTTAGVLTISAMKGRRIGEGDDVLILGFAPEPAGLPPVPLVRRGIIARIQDCYHGSAKTFLVDATIFEGNRGSPVVMKPEHPAADRPWNDPAGKLIGVVSESLRNPCGPVRTTQDGRSLDVRVHTGLVRVAPVDALRALLERGARDGRC